jgi:hypothetical protein
MKRALWVVLALMALSAPQHVSGSGATAKNRRPSIPLGATAAPSKANPGSVPIDPMIGMVDDGRETTSRPEHPVAEPGAVAITSMGLLAAAAYRKKRSQKQP